jgi:hexosaminidase
MDSIMTEPPTATLPALLPMPRHLEMCGGVCDLALSGVIVVETTQASALSTLVRLAQQVQASLSETARRSWPIIAGSAGTAGAMPLTLNLTPGSTAHEQGYSLTITPERIDAVAATPTGLFYAVQTLVQLLQLSGERLPTLRCTDWPDFATRGVMLDVTRGKVPSMQTLFETIDMLASWKINQVQLYFEHIFAYRNHPQVSAGASPISGEEILALDAYCRQRFIELVPNQNTFGHLTKWLIHDRYRNLAEAPDGCDTRWGHYDTPLSLNPGDPASLELVRSMLDELLPHFTSRQVNVGCDETIDLGHGRSKQAVEERGEGRVYLEYLLKIHQEVQRRGYTMQYWGDIIMEHPELTPELPRNALALEWGYQADHPFDAHGALFAASGIPFVVCPGTSSWNSIVGRTDNALENLRNAAHNGRKHGAVGYLITDWGDNGHWQPLPVSFVPMAYGAALAWGYERNIDADICASVDAFRFGDDQRRMARIAYDLGNVDQVLGIPIHNRSALFSILLHSPNEMIKRIPAGMEMSALLAALQQADQRLQELAAELALVTMRCPDAELMRSEYGWGIAMLRHACRRGRWVVDHSHGQQDAALARELQIDTDQLIAEFERIWHARNRPGGFITSVARLQAMRDEYGQ